MDDFWWFCKFIFGLCGLFGGGFVGSALGGVLGGAIGLFCGFAWLIYCME